MNRYGKPVPNSIKKGIRDTFMRFNENTLAEYDRNKYIKLRDLILLTHIKGRTDEENELLKRILHNKLANPVITQNHLIEKNELPFSYYGEYKQLKNEGIQTPKTYEDFNRAMSESLENMPRFKGITFIACDVSETMGERFPMEGMGMTSGEIGALLIAIAGDICVEPTLRTFSYRLNKFPLTNKGGIIQDAESVRIEGGKTDMFLPFYELISEKITVDRIIIISDSTGGVGRAQWIKHVEEYRRKVNPEVWVHGIDCTGYGGQKFYGERTNIIDGWNEKTFRFIYQIENGIDKIRTEVERCYY